MWKFGDSSMINGRVFGYARAKSKKRNLNKQIKLLRQYVSEEKIITEIASGKDLNRPAYQAMKSPLGLREGDILIIPSLDRISKNQNIILSEIKWFVKNKVRLKVLDLPSTLIEVVEGDEWIVELINSVLVEVFGSMSK